MDPEPLVQVRLPRHLTAAWNVPARLEVQAASFPRLLAALDAKVPGLSRRVADDRGDLRRHLLLFINEEPVAGEALSDLALTAGDRVLFVASVSGG